MKNEERGLEAILSCVHLCASVVILCRIGAYAGNLRGGRALTKLVSRR